MDIDLSPLLLPKDAERVLRALLDGRSRSSASLSRELALSATAVSRAVRLLDERGLVHVPPTRPAPVTLARVGDAVQAMAGQVQREASDRQDQLLELAEKLAGRGEDHAVAGHEFQELNLRGCDAEFRRERGCRHVDVIVPAGAWSSFASCPPWRRTTGARYRLLLAQKAEGVPVPIDGEVRQHPDALPAMAVVDGQRARVDVVIAGIARHGWTFDPRQVRALARLFDLLWAEAAAQHPSG